MILFSSNILKPTINLRTFGEDKITKNTFIFWSSRKLEDKAMKKYRKNSDHIVSKIQKYFWLFLEFSWILIIGILQVMEGHPKKTISKLVCSYYVNSKRQ
jgi:hypothetical protein